MPVSVDCIECSIPTHLRKIESNTRYRVEDCTSSIAAQHIIRRQGKDISSIVTTKKVVTEHRNGSIKRRKYNYVPVYCDDLVVLASGLPVRFPGATIVTEKDGTRAIVINNALQASVSWITDAIIEHELAHICLGHLKSGPRLNNAIRIIMHEDAEIEADAYAARTTQMRNALGYLNHLGVDTRSRIEALDQ